MDAQGRRYDARGTYLGRTDPDGRHYDARGAYLGRIDSDGRRYDARGAYLGRVVPGTSTLFDARGRRLGQLEGNGRLYDSQGRFLGRIDENGRRHDADRSAPVPTDPGAASSPRPERVVPRPDYCTLGELGCVP